jgi:hypothetical protein
MGIHEEHEAREVSSKKIVFYKVFGFSSALLGFLFLAFFGFNVTGNVISETDFYLDNIFGFVAGIVLLILSFVAFKTLREEEGKLRKVFE